MEASARLYREPMIELEFSLGRHTDDDKLADHVAELLTKMNEPIGDHNPWSLIGNAQALLTLCVGRVQEQSEQLEDARRRIAMVPYKGA